MSISRRREASIDREVAIVKAQMELLERREADFQNLLDEVARLQDSVRTEKLSLQVKQQKLEEERHPVNWLPAELLLHVFVAFCEDVSPVSAGYHQPPVILSHVSRKWREIAISASSLWSHIVCRRNSQLSDEDPMRVFIARSRNSPLYITYDSCSLKLTSRAERDSIDMLLQHLINDSHRVETIVLQTRREGSVVPVIKALLSNQFPSLLSLELSVDRQPGDYTDNLHFVPDRDDPKWTSGLKHLRLAQVPLSTLPAYFLLNLKSVELSFPLRKHPTQNRPKRLYITALCQFLLSIPRLEDLVLSNTILYFDALPRLQYQEYTANEIKSTVPPVELPYLRKLEWSYPQPREFLEALAFLTAPNLERLDLAFDDVGTVDRTPSSTPDQVRYFASLRELGIQSVGEDAVSSVLRKFSFPLLEKVELANVDPRLRNRTDAVLPALPRLESLFRDPRLPHLTHLTLSHFSVHPEHGRAMLGYMPALVALALDTCSGVGELLRLLTEQPVTAATTNSASVSGARVRGVKFCARLQSLDIWTCQGVEFEDVHAVVRARNGRGSGGGDDGGDAGGRGQFRLMGAAQTGQAGDGIEGEVMGRKIRPLRRLRRQVQGPHDASLGLGAAIIPSASVISTVIARQDACVADITHARLEGCQRITEAQAMSLKDLGVVDVLWK